MSEPVSWEEITQDAENPDATHQSKLGWLKRGAKKTRAMAANRTVWIMAAIALVFLAAGILVSQFVISPSQAAAETAAPEAGPITVPIEKKKLSNDIVTRGDAVYDDAVKVTLETADLKGPAVVTGAVPTVGQELSAGNIALEVAGRPVITLPGELPAYRTLVSGATGPDVVQLRTALQGMGFDPGTGDVYDSSLAAAVSALYAQVGYPAPTVDEGIRSTLTAARQNVTQAEEALVSAQAALDAAGGGPSEAERIALDNAVNSAARDLEEAKSGKGAMRVADAEDALRLAQAQRNDGLQGKSVDAEVAARDAAASAVDQAYEDLADAEAEALTPLPMSEVVYFPNLPRRVDSVDIARGQTLEGKPAFSVSGANLEIVASLANADASFVEVDDAVNIETDGDTLPGKITKVEAETAKEGETAKRSTLTIVPDKLTEEQRSKLAGTNVKIVIPVGATDGEVLVVPVAALTAGAGGETRVEVMREGSEEPELVIVETGLTAKGYAELIDKEGKLSAGDLVVVGNQGDDEPESSN